MIKNLFESAWTPLWMAALAVVLIALPKPVLAGNTVSQGGGVKCYWVLVSSDPATGSNVYTRVCRKGGA